MAKVGPRGLVLLVFALVVVVSITVAGCAARSEPLSPEELEKVAQGIDKSLMCPVCPSETIDQSQVEIAKQMRVMVREKLAQGESREAILQFFVDRYGQGILAEPPKSGFNLLVWVLPPIALLLAGGILAMTVRAMRRGRLTNAQDVAPPATAELEPYLFAVDREIQRLGGGTVRKPFNTAPEDPDAEALRGRTEQP